jgi:hypothetical protein
VRRQSRIVRTDPAARTLAQACRTPRSVLCLAYFPNLAPGNPFCLMQEEKGPKVPKKKTERLD